MVYEETHLYKNLFKEVINMGVQNDNNFEGSIFERSLNLMKIKTSMIDLNHYQNPKVNGRSISTVRSYHQ